jgi:hypothetical protein
MTTNEEQEWKVDRTDWPPGPWDGEPDKLQFSHMGLPCLIVRNNDGTLCGYAGLPPGHPAREVEADDLPVSVHGGLTYRKKCNPPVCHVPEPGETDDILWLGFDCGHVLDGGPERDYGDYRDVAYVRAQCERLAEQLQDLT